LAPADCQFICSMEDEGLSNMMGIGGFGKQKKVKQDSTPIFDDARPLAVSSAPNLRASSES
jgi:hypothetical protein